MQKKLNRQKPKRSRQQTKLPQNIRIAVWFFIAVLMLILFSFALKTFFTLKQSLFDGTHRFTLLVTKQPGTYSIYSFAPDQNTMSHLTVSNVPPKSNIGRDLSLSIDATATCTNNDCRSMLKESIPDSLQSMLFHYKSLKTKATFTDFLRLFFYAKGVSKSQTMEKTISEKDDARLQQDTMSICCIDDAIIKEYLSIAIVNASGKAGFGNRLGKLLTNMGATVVVIGSSDKERETSEIVYDGKKTYTVSVLEKLIPGAKLTIDRKGISDIIVRIGKDQAEESSY